MASEFLAAVLAAEQVQDALLAIGHEPLLAGKWKHRQSRADPTYATSLHVGRTRRCQRIYLLDLATRGVLVCPEIDHYASVIAERRANGVWPKGEPPPILLSQTVDRLAAAAARNAESRPRLHTVTVAASTLAECVQATRSGEDEDLVKNDQRRLSQVLRYLGLDPRSHRPSRDAAAAKKRRQRHAKVMEPIVAAERAHLDAEAAAGRMIRLSEDIYVSTTRAEAASDRLESTGAAVQLATIEANILWTEGTGRRLDGMHPSTQCWERGCRCDDCLASRANGHQP